MRIEFQGAAHTVTGSLHILRVNGTTLLLNQCDISYCAYCWHQYIARLRMSFSKPILEYFFRNKFFYF